MYEVNSKLLRERLKKIGITCDGDFFKLLHVARREGVAEEFRKYPLVDENGKYIRPRRRKRNYIV